MSRSQPCKSMPADYAWTQEPDQQVWEHAGLMCVALRVPDMGHWTGYVSLPPEHPCFEVQWFEVQWGEVQWGELPAEVHSAAHGGVNFSAAMAEGQWWIGFDCARAGDLTSFEVWVRTTTGVAVETLANLGGWARREYRPLGYVTERVNRLAEAVNRARAH